MSDAKTVFTDETSKIVADFNHISAVTEEKGEAVLHLVGGQVLKTTTAFNEVLEKWLGKTKD